MTALASTAFERLPRYLQDSDTSGHLAAYVEMVWGQLDTVAQIHERIDVTPRDEGGVVGDTSDLVDPVTAASGWLAWLGQNVGLVFDESAELLGPEISARRSAIAAAAVSWATAGTLDEIVDAVKAVLTGDQVVRVVQSAWRLTLGTRPSETPNPAAVVEALSSVAIEAGLLVAHLVATGPWLDLSTDWPGATGTWADYGTAGTSGTAAVYGTFEYGEAVYGAGGAAGLWGFFGSWEP